ncbi:MAG TPA: D-alanyl-D-alanine carboxypeptidase [Thermoleophilaceae bacterium]|nr:D-alanyl-D-alanine carboxypeptidase [Thermoleophilaceae bacterium]
MRRGPSLSVIAAVALAALPAPAAASPESGLRKSLSRLYGSAGPHASIFVRRASDRRTLFARKQGTPRILASNTKLFAVGAALDRYGADGRLVTRAMSGARLDDEGLLRGNLYFVGGGDVTFGSRDYVRSEYGGGGGTVEKLAQRLKDHGLRRVRGHVVGDESLYDSRRSGPAEGYQASAEVGGPLTALVYNHGLMSNGYFQRDPPSYAAGRLTDALQDIGVEVGKGAKSGRAPSGADELAATRSLPMARIGLLTMQPSDNFFAELLAKGLGDGTTAGGARSLERFAEKRGADVNLSDGSGLSRANKAPTQEVVRFLHRQMDDAREFDEFFDALPTAGETGTLADRMTSGPAHRHCHAKTGTLYGVSALSGYCDARGGSRLIFSILMNGVSSDSGAHSIQDRMARSMANYNG